MKMKDTSKCCTCQYEWQTGQDGHHSCSVVLNEKLNAAIDHIFQYGGIDGAHHKMWTLDQAMRILAGDRYDEFVAKACAGEDGPATYEWDCGIAP